MPVGRRPRPSLSLTLPLATVFEVAERAFSLLTSRKYLAINRADLFHPAEVEDNPEETALRSGILKVGNFGRQRAERRQGSTRMAQEESKMKAMGRTAAEKGKKGFDWVSEGVGFAPDPPDLMLFPRRLGRSPQSSASGATYVFLQHDTAALRADEKL